MGLMMMFITHRQVNIGVAFKNTDNKIRYRENIMASNVKYYGITQNLDQKKWEVLVKINISSLWF